MYKCVSCGWEFRDFKMIKTAWSDGIESCPNCKMTLMEGIFESVIGIKPNNKDVKVIRFPLKD